MSKKILGIFVIMLFIITTIFQNIQITTVKAEELNDIESDSSVFNIQISYKLIVNANGPYLGYKNVNISFNGSASGGATPYTWYWTFGDGNTSTQQNPKHAYASTGNFNVTLKVTDASSNCDYDTTYAKVITELVADAGGPYHGVTKTDIWFTGSAVGGEPPYYFSWDLDNDGNYTDAYGEVVHHNYDSPGIYSISIKVRDKLWIYSINTTLVTVEMNNTAPNKPTTPSGETNGKVDQPYRYESSTTDIDGDKIYYLFDWGDGNNTGWMGPYTSGQKCTELHTWNTKGNYAIKVKAKDIYGAESPWSDPLPITMPYSYNKLLFLELLFQRFPNAFPILRQILGY
jgi:PKD repeat protein